MSRSERPTTALVNCPLSFLFSFFVCLAPHSFFSTLSLLPIVVFAVLSNTSFAYAQSFAPTAKNGQIFTNGLAIIDAPQMSRYAVLKNYPVFQPSFKNPYHNHIAPNMLEVTSC